MVENKQIKVEPRKLEDVVRNIFVNNGLSGSDAEVAARALVKANLRGVDSHGVARVPMYCERLRQGAANPKPKISVSRVSPAVVMVDGDDGLGLIVGPMAMSNAIENAMQYGIGAAGVHRSGHYGMAALYVLQAIEAGCIGMAYTNASPAIPVWGGREKFLGTNPIAVGVPTGTKTPFVMDMACSIVARGKLKFAAQRGESIPAGLALDSNGRPTTDGTEAFNGVVLPFGGMKGAALSFLMDILSGVFTGAAFGGEVRNPFTGIDGPQNTGHLFVALKTDLFMDKETFEERMQALVSKAKSQPLAYGFKEIMIPGEPEYQNEKKRNNGIPLTFDVLESLKSEAESAGVHFPDILTP